MEFLDGAPLAAFRAAAQPFRPAPAAFGTYKLRGRLCHIADNTDILGQSFSEILRGGLVRDDGEITVSGFERLTDMKE